MKTRIALRILLLACLLAAVVIPASADVWLPSALVEIEAQAFMNASWLSGSCTIPEGTKSIGMQAFYNCSGITSLTIPSTVTYIGSQSFAGCTGLTGTITIPEGCQVEADAFANCPKATIVQAGQDPAELFTWSIADGEVTITGFKGGSSVTSVAVPGSIDGLPVTTIGSYAFSSNRYLTSITLPGTITTINNHAFSYCAKLQSLTIPTSVTTVGRYAFYYCSSLTGVINLIDSDVPSNAFTGCKGLTVFTYSTNSDGTLTLTRCYGSASSVSVPRRVGKKVVTVIGREAFSFRNTLQQITLPGSITEIGPSAFYYCSALESISLPNGVTTIGASAFYNCSALASLSLPDSITTIGSMAFYSCTKLSGTLSFVDAAINASAFNSCPDMEIWCYESISDAEVQLASCHSSCSAISVPASVQDYTVTGMRPQAFYNCSAVTSITLPETFTAICDEAFYKCTTLRSISIPATIRSIGVSAFYGCDALTSVSIPASVTTVGNQAFYSCDALTTLTVGSSSTTLSAYSFADCAALTTVNMSGNYSNVGNMAFTGTAWMTEKVADVARSVTSGCSTAYDKALALHDWLIENTAYDLTYTYYGPEGVLFHGEGVCNAYTLTYSMLLDAVGIPNMTISGTATDKNSGTTGSHAWTLVQMNGSWYHVDTTWDDPIPDGRERHTYFALTDAQMSADHTWNTANYPAANGASTLSSSSRSAAETAEDATVLTDAAEDASEAQGSSVQQNKRDRKDKKH